MSLNDRTLPGINPVSASRLGVTDEALADASPITLSVGQVLHGLVSYAAVTGARVLNLPT
ncbi:unnamed protein product, partial [marine sediment metagenome]